MTSSAENHSNRTAWIARAPLSALVVASVALIAGFAMNHGDPASLLQFSDISLTAVSVGGGLTTLLLALRIRGRDRRSWLLIGAGILSWGLGQAIWSYCELVLGMDRPFPSLADAGYVPMIPLMFAGLVTLHGTGQRYSGRLTVALDAFIVMAALASVSWWAVLGPIYAKADIEFAEKFFGLLYPAGRRLAALRIDRGRCAWLVRGAQPGRGPTDDRDRPVHRGRPWLRILDCERRVSERQRDRPGLAVGLPFHNLCRSTPSSVA